MPVIRSAKKKLKQDKKRTVERAKFEDKVKDAVKKATASATLKTVSKAFSLLDKAAKSHVFHANKAARIKSRLANLLSPKKKEVSVEKPVRQAQGAKSKKVVKKTSSKKSSQ